MVRVQNENNDDHDKPHKVTRPLPDRVIFICSDFSTRTFDSINDKYINILEEYAKIDLS